jgi:hypothetical protein
MSRLLGSIPPMDPPPLVFINACESARTYPETLKAASQLAETIRVTEIDGQYVWSVNESQRPVITKDDLLALLDNNSHFFHFSGHGWPTAADLAEADQTLRTQVLPETSPEELQEAASEVIRDPEKLKLIASLREAIDQATGVPGSSPWVVFVVAFCVCLKINPDPVTSAGTALALVAIMQAASKG